MKSQPFLRRCLPLLSLLAIGLGIVRSSLAAPTNIFFTQFETTEGYTTISNLVGQNSWVGDGSGGNGIVSNFFSGQKHQAYIGYDRPDSGDDSLFVWRPINFNPIAAGLPLVKFSVQVRIVDSSTTNANYDYFRFSVYNIQGDRLFSIEFDNPELYMNYELSGTNELFLTDVPFFNTNVYSLNVTMNFASNLWSATLGSALIATNEAIRTIDIPLNLGDIDAVWLIRTNGRPGDNYMLFDNYRVTAEALSVPSVPPSQMQFLGRTPQGWTLLRTSGSNGTRWSIDATANFVSWTALVTNTISGTSFDHIDMTATPFSRRFYRARFVP